jgi:hypothetical protein
VSICLSIIYLSIHLLFKKSCIEREFEATFHSDVAFLIISKRDKKMGVHKDRTSGSQTICVHQVIRNSQPRYLGVNSYLGEILRTDVSN